jgi:hypothetical protein
MSDDTADTVELLADYVYGTIATLTAVGGISFDDHPEALTTAGVVVVSTVAIWLAHALSRLVAQRARRHLLVTRADVRAELWGSWSILAAAVPAVVILVVAGLHLWTVHEAFVIINVVGVGALAAVGFGTAGGAERSLGRRLFYVVGIVAVGAMIVGLESLVHIL